MSRIPVGRQSRVSASAAATAAALLVLLAAACGDEVTGPSEEALIQAAAAGITAAELRNHVEALADDSTLGRASPSPQLEEVALYIADVFERSGLRPGGEDGTWFQRFPVDRGSGPTGTAPNVIGWVPGSDPTLSDEYVVYTAHFDHLGYRAGSAPGTDSIYNGADDNASGTAALLELAEAFGSMPTPPPCSVVFLAVSGEERGLIGSLYYRDHPLFPLERTRANLNMDMLGRNDPGSIEVIRGAVSTVAGTIRDVAGANPSLGLEAMDVEDLSLMHRSDVWAFYGSGVDAAFLHSGLHQDYHQVSDEADRLDYGKLERVARLAYLAGIETAGRSQEPPADGRPGAF